MGEDSQRGQWEAGRQNLGEVVTLLGAVDALPQGDPCEGSLQGWRGRVSGGRGRGEQVGRTLGGGFSSGPPQLSSEASDHPTLPWQLEQVRLPEKDRQESSPIAVPPSFQPFGLPQGGTQSVLSEC